MQNHSAYFEELKKNMSPENLENYKKIGEKFFSNFDFQTGYMFKLNGQLDEAPRLVSLLKSGLAVEDLSEDEIKILEKSFGGDWRKTICVQGDCTSLSDSKT